MDITFLLGGGILASLIVGTLKEVFGKVEGRWGKTVTLVVLFAASCGVAGLGAAFKLLPQNIAESVLSVFTTGITLYEVFYKAIYLNGIKGDAN